MMAHCVLPCKADTLIIQLFPSLCHYTMSLFVVLQVEHDGIKALSLELLNVKMTRETHRNLILRQRERERLRDNEKGNERCNRTDKNEKNDEECLKEQWRPMNHKEVGQRGLKEDKTVRAVTDVQLSNRTAGHLHSNKQDADDGSLRETFWELIMRTRL